MKNQKVYRFKILLLSTDPEIWREIEVPGYYNFWELHVAIQDAMGWLDYHLHEFTPKKSGPTKKKRIGIPDSEYDDEVIAGLEVLIQKYFTTLGNSLTYAYDFGDGWQHEVVLTGTFLAEGFDTPKCTGGEMACPPEDCGGISGYQDLLEIISDKKHTEYKDTVEWLKGHAKKYWPYSPTVFNSHDVKFEDPYKRWCTAFGQPFEN